MQQKPFCWSLGNNKSHLCLCPELCQRMLVSKQRRWWNSKTQYRGCYRYHNQTRGRRSDSPAFLTRHMSWGQSKPPLGGNAKSQQPGFKALDVVSEARMVLVLCPQWFLNKNPKARDKNNWCTEAICAFSQCAEELNINASTCYTDKCHNKPLIVYYLAVYCYLFLSILRHNSRLSGHNLLLQLFNVIKASWYVANLYHHLFNTNRNWVGGKICWPKGNILVPTTLSPIFFNRNYLFWTAAGISHRIRVLHALF